MILRRLQAENYRNIESIELEPDPCLTVISGPNGQGKTNLLESIWMLSGAKSFRSSRDAELVRRGEARCRVQGTIETGQPGDAPRDIAVAVTIDPATGRAARTAQKNGVDYGRAGSLAGEFPCVVFAPGHIGMLRGSPESRRRFLDSALCQLYPGYLACLRRYTRAVLQKNAALKKSQDIGVDPGLLDTFDEQMALYGADVSRRRRDYLERLIPAAEQHYNGIAGGREALCMTYAPHCPGEWEQETLLAALKKARPLDLRTGFCTEGVHRDDIAFSLDGAEARLYASQGQQRSVVLSCKIAELETAGTVTGLVPVLLLDDVLSELDAARQDYLLNRIEGKQVFITSCGTELFRQTGGRIVTMENGRLI